MRAVLGIALAGVLFGVALAQTPTQRVVKPGRNVQDADDISSPDSKVWVLDFKFKDPRFIKVNIPGRGQKLCWYMWYQVTNFTKQPQTFIPDFELVAFDSNMQPVKTYRDQILPTVQDAIKKIEDPTGYYNIRNSVTIMANPIPVSKADATPRSVTGVAIWEGVEPQYNRFSIFVAGLSNGWALTDPIPPEKQPVVRRKTLQLNFRRLGDGTLNRAEDLRFIPPAQWTYRGEKLIVPGLPGAPKEASPAAAPAPREPAPKDKEGAAERLGAARKPARP